MSKILVIDDSSIDREVVSTILDDAGFYVLVADSGLSGMRIAESHQPDLILLDINLPDINGIEVCRFFRAREQSKHIPILFLSALNENDLKAAAIESGGSDFISKPFRTGILLNRVKAHLELTALKTRMQSENETFFDTFNLAPVGIAQISLDGGWLQANLHLLNKLGYGLDQLQKLKVKEITATTDLHNSLLQLVNNKNENYSEESRFIAKNGASFNANIKAKLVLDRHDKAKYLIAVISETPATN